MAWSLKWGEHVKAFESQARRSRKPDAMPAPLKNRPRLQQQDLPYHEAFCVLSKARQSGAHGSQAIPVSEIKAYLELVGIASLTAKSKYLSLVQDLDQMCLEHWVEKQQAARDDRRNQSRT